MSINLKRLHSCLTMACHEASNSNEAHNAAKAVDAMLKRAGYSISDLRVGGQSSPATSQINVQLAQANDENLRLRRELSDAHRKLQECSGNVDRAIKLAEALHAQREQLEDQLGRALGEVQLLKRKSEKHKTRRSRSDVGVEYVKFDDVARVAEARCGRKTWMSAIAFALHMPMAELNAWRKVGIFPAHLALKINTLDGSKCAYSSRKRWTNQEFERLEALLLQEVSDLEIAVFLTAEFGRNIYEASVARRRRILSKRGHPNLRSAAGTFDNPSRAPARAERASTLRRRPQTRSRMRLTG